jgi:hypothetical protein
MLKSWNPWGQAVPTHIKVGLGIHKEYVICKSTKSSALLTSTLIIKVILTCSSTMNLIEAQLSIMAAFKPADNPPAPHLGREPDLQ